MTLPSFIPLPDEWQRRYQKLRVLLYLIMITLVVLFASRVFFPTITQSFDFRPGASNKGMILNLRSPLGAPRTNGKIEQNGTLLADTTVVGDFSTVSVTAELEKKSALPKTLTFSLRRSYQSFFYPTGTAVSDFPQETAYHINDTYYILRNGTLFPFVSEQAFLSRFPEGYALAADATLLKKYPVSEEWLGFRVGSLISNAIGVFVVTSETEVRPVSSVDIFLALGYDFQDVVPVSEEELGIYKKGRIILLGAAHPDGTLLRDQDDGSYYLVDQGTKRPLLPGAYRDFLLAHAHPVLASTSAQERSAACTLLPGLFRSTLSCTASIAALTPGFGSDFQIQVKSPETDIDIRILTVSFETAKNRQNALTLLSQIKQLFLVRFGATQ